MNSFSSCPLEEHISGEEHIESTEDPGELACSSPKEGLVAHSFIILVVITSISEASEEPATVTSKVNDQRVVCK